MTLTIDLPDEIAAALKARAEAEGMTAKGWLRHLVEERLHHGREDDRPVSEMIREIWADMPDDVRAKLPTDGASQVDHYVYGLPKRNQ